MKCAVFCVGLLVAGGVCAGEDFHRIYEEAGKRAKAVASARVGGTTRLNWISPTQAWYLRTGTNGVAERMGVDAGSGSCRPVTADDPVFGACLKSLDCRIDRIASSSAGGESALLSLTNVSGRAVSIFWIDMQGRRDAYGTIAKDAVWRQNTFVGHVWLVADGKTDLAVFRVSAAQDAGEIPAQSAIDTAPLPAGPDPAVSPDGRWRAEIDKHNLVLRDTASGEKRVLTRDGKREDGFVPVFAWSPDSRHLVAMRRIPGGDRKIAFVEAAPKDQLQPKLHKRRYLKPGDPVDRDRPCLFAAETGAQIAVANALFDNPWDLSDLGWKPDGSAFRFVYNQRGHQTMRVIEVGLDGAARALVDETCATFFCYSSKFFFQVFDKTDELLWMSERSGWNHLYLYDGRTGQVKGAVTSGEWVVKSVEAVDEAARKVYFYAVGVVPGQDPYYHHYCSVNFDGTDFRVLTAGDGTHTVALSPDGRFFVDTWSHVDQAPVSVLRDRADGRQICELERGDTAELAAAGWRAPERFVAKGRDGVTDIYGVIWRPRAFDPAKRYPVLEYIYAGPHDAFVPKAFSAGFRQDTLAELGFIVVQIDGMGTNWRSKSFHDVAWRHVADAGFPDRIAWMKAAAARYPQLDLSRVGIYGGSAGGQNALGALLWHGAFYKAAAADCGCHDNRMDKIWWNEQWMGWPVGPHYVEQSNVTQAHRLRGALLLTVGEMDDNVDPATTMQVADALIKADKDFELLIMPGENHGAGERPYAARRRAAFFIRNLGGPQ